MKLDISPGSTPKSSATIYTGVPYHLSAQGSYKQVMAFLGRLENGPHFCHFSNVAFGKVGGGVTAQTAMTLTINLELLGQP